MNRAAQTLTTIFAPRGAQKQLSERTGIDQGYLSKLASGKAVAGLKVRQILRDELGIALDAWDEPTAEATETAEAS